MVAVYRDRVTALYTRYAPDQLDRVDGLLREFSGREDALLAALQNKYVDDVAVRKDGGDVGDAGDAGGAPDALPSADDDDHDGDGREAAQQPAWRPERPRQQQQQLATARGPPLPDGWRAAPSRWSPGLTEYENAFTRERVEQRPAHPAQPEPDMSPDLYANDPDTLAAMVHYAAQRAPEDPDRAEDTAVAALYAAARTGDPGAFDAVLARGDFAGAATLDATDAYAWTALHRAALFGSADVCRALLGRPDFHLASAGDRGGMNALHWASFKGNAEVVDMLLASDAFSRDAVNAGDASGDTALHQAARYGHAGVARALLGHARFAAAAANALEEDGCSALHHAAERGHAGCVRVLLDAYDFDRDTVNAQAADGSTALHLAVDGKHAEVCEALLAHPRFLNVDAVEMSGTTALHMACDNALPELCALILAHPGCAASVNAGDAEFGVTPLHVCAERGLVDVAARILVHPSFDWGANVDVDNPTPAMGRLLQRIRDEVRPEQLVAVLAAHAAAGASEPANNSPADDSPGRGLAAAAGPRSPRTPPTTSAAAAGDRSSGDARATAGDVRAALEDAMGEMRSEMQQMREASRQQREELAAIEHREFMRSEVRAALGDGTPTTRKSSCTIQ